MPTSEKLKRLESEVLDAQDALGVAKLRLRAADIALLQALDRGQSDNAGGLHSAMRLILDTGFLDDDTTNRCTCMLQGATDEDIGIHTPGGESVEEIRVRVAEVVRDSIERAASMGMSETLESRLNHIAAKVVAGELASDLMTSLIRPDERKEAMALCDQRCNEAAWLHMSERLYNWRR